MLEQTGWFGSDPVAYEIAKLVNIIPRTMAYDTYNYS